MNVLLINYEYPSIGGGAATETFHIARCLVKQGHTVFVITSCFSQQKGWSMEDGINVYRCLSLRKKVSQSNMLEMFSFLVSAFLLLPGILKKQKIEAAIVFFSLPCGPLGLWGKLICDTPYIVALQGGDVPGNEAPLDRIHKILMPLRRTIFKKSLAVIANSKGLKDLSEKADPFPVKVIHNGVDTDFFHPVSKPNNNKTRFLFVGRFQEQKNLFLLLDQIKILKQVLKKDFELHLVGDGPLANKLKNYAANINMEESIFWHGWCAKEELRQHYQHADCIINPSLYEGMPNVLLEAMACGVPIIASNVIGNDAVVRDKETGFLFDLEKPEQFQQAFKEILNDASLAREMGIKARKWVECDFSWDNVASEYMNFFCNEPKTRTNDGSNIKEPLRR